MTGAGKSVIVADLLAQAGHRFGFRLIVENVHYAAFRHSKYPNFKPRPLGCKPVIVNPNGLP
jgi:hypothetical protein